MLWGLWLKDSRVLLSSIKGGASDAWPQITREADCNWVAKRLDAVHDLLVAAVVVVWLHLVLMVAACMGCFVVWSLRVSDLSSLYQAWTATWPDHIAGTGWVSYQQQICARLRSLVWSEELTNDKLLSEALPPSKVVFFWRVIASSGTRNFVRRYFAL